MGDLGDAAAKFIPVTAPEAREHFMLHRPRTRRPMASLHLETGAVLIDWDAVEAEATDPDGARNMARLLLAIRDGRYTTIG